MAYIHLSIYLKTEEKERKKEKYMTREKDTS